MDLQQATLHCRLLADSTRLRLLFLLEREELTVAELAAITQLAQPRVSTHLAKLKEAGLVNDRRQGVFVFYRMSGRIADASLAAMWELLRQNTDDPLTQQDLERLPQVLNARDGDSNWADSVAGDMERHYSPGRTWEATARALAQLVQLGEVLDIASGDGVLAELLAPQARRITCLDISRRVVKAGQARLADVGNVTFEQGDMHELPFADRHFDTVLLMHALTYTRRPARVFSEAARVLKPGGQLLAVTLSRHKHEKSVAPYNHVNLGFTVGSLEKHCRDAGLEPVACRVSAVEKRAPHFAVITLLATPG
ncbi:MAG: metalloregulator ArsR/SmtB family transcription factor [Xanthomonadales bacterium]|nr:metalloregulator ArsR/SmtB family transcription factor [Xanthomonadales bacterium]NIN32846.1 metalloregulator ArsR/SmtB family transcription factor [Hydrogenophaga sp.]NIN59180.1 metalloregulator ArsR/SmtB family transcription factor [Xanthomonadales bacterium]NIN74242.1 metalloregulator ArsR/SmtB family transcription factor [Xanthomonadales bacterium]NIO12479.1 metalloregulator ArsR/SmtB family transcription factor [Xanthomonadales bacterium]